MGKLPVISAKKLIKILKGNGANIIRQKGSHVFIEFNGNVTTIPIHSNKDLGKGIIAKIFYDLGINDFDNLKN